MVDGVLPSGVEPLSDSDPRTVGPYAILGRLGSGAMGRVYLGRRLVPGESGGAAEPAEPAEQSASAASGDSAASDESDEPDQPEEPAEPEGRQESEGRQEPGAQAAPAPAEEPFVAVKVVREDLADQAMYRRRFAHEIASARQVVGPRTAAVLDCDPDADRPWIATEFVAGPSLSAAVEGAGPLAPDAVRRLGAGIAEALTTIHGLGIVHRDLKPSNVLLADDGPKVIDFGVARAADQTQLTATGQLAGTPAYMAPEWVEAKAQPGPSGDVFALGALLAYALTGRPAFGVGPPLAILHRVLNAEPDLEDVPDGVSDLVALIRACLAKKAENRPELARIGDVCRGAAVLPGEWAAAVAASAASAASAEQSSGAASAKAVASKASKASKAAAFQAAASKTAAADAVASGTVASGTAASKVFKAGSKAASRAAASKAAVAAGEPSIGDLTPAATTPVLVGVPSGEAEATSPSMWIDYWQRSVEHRGVVAGVGTGLLAVVTAIIVAFAVMAQNTGGAGAVATIGGHGASSTAAGGAGGATSAAGVAAATDHVATASRGTSTPSPGLTPTPSGTAAGAQNTPSQGAAGSQVPVFSTQPSAPPLGGSGQPSSTAGPTSNPAQTSTSANPPTSTTTVSGPVTPAQLGPPDFAGYCQATGQGSLTTVDSTAYGLRCSQDNGTGLGADRVCAWTYNSTRTIDRVADFAVPSTWQCWAANGQLGTPDFSAYCQGKGATDAFLDSTVNTVYGWFCTGATSPVDVQDVCLVQFHSSPPISRFQNYHDPNTWQCWG